jgi:thiosulfate/3-mercaptopyruvate sulfurtransferase
MTLQKTFIFLLLLVGFSGLLAEGRDFLVDAEWLEAEKANNSNLVILEVRYHPHRYYTVGHIENAIQVQRFKDLGDNFADPIMRFPSKDTFEQTLRSWGVNQDSTIVIYDDSLTALAARLYVMLELFGYDMQQVKILDGGILAWTGFNDLTTEDTPMPQPGNVVLTEANPHLLVEWPEVYAEVLAKRNPQVVLVDARPHDMYTGAVIRHAVQGGHIPGAINIVSLDGVDGPSQSWKSADYLAAMYQDIPKDKTVYLYCHDGFRMSLGFLQLKSLGFTDVRLMNGGWSAWDRAMTLPVVKGEAPYDAEYGL